MDIRVLLLIIGTVLTVAIGKISVKHESNDIPVGTENPQPPVVKIGIVGGGIGGCAASWFLREGLKDKHVEVTLFERDKIGGRVDTVTLNDHEYEAGASIFHEKNMIFQNFLQEFGLKMIDHNDDSDITAIASGSEILFQTTGSSVADAIKSIWRYGLSPLKLGSWVNDYLTSFMKIYDLQARNCSYLRPSEMILAADEKFADMLREPLSNRMKTDGFSEKFINEIAASATRVNYNQRNSIPAFVGSVSLAGMKGPVYSVKGGNRQVAVQACQAATRIVSSPVSVIESLPNQKLRVYHPDVYEDYDYVILASPLERNATNVVFKNFPNFFHPVDWAGSYQRTVATFVEGKLNHTFFGSSTHLDNVFNIQPDSSWSSVGTQSDVTGNASTTSGHPVFKIFSTLPLSAELVGQMFVETFGQTTVVDWKAYPNYAEPPLHPPPFNLYGRHLFYLNAVEWIGSAMEMSLIAAKNVALAIVNQIEGVHPGGCGAVVESSKSDL